MDETFQQSVHDWHIFGHERAIDILCRTLQARQIRHAYLLVGPQRIGKRLLARRFAQTLLCTGGEDPHHAPLAPCQNCLACRKILHGNHPDLHYITRAPDKQFIVIEQIREIQAATSRRSMEGRYNIFLIDNAHEMNAQAANCLLKTLEEPEPGVILLLTVPDSSLLLPTVLSRVQMIQMQLLTTLQIRHALTKQWQVTPADAELIAALAVGRMGWAVQAVEDEEMLSERNTLLESLINLPSMSTVQRFDFVQKLGVDSAKAEAILELWLLWWRDLALGANQCSDLTVNVDRRNEIAQQAKQITSRTAERMIRAILRTRETLSQNVNARLALEVLMLELPTLKR